MRKTRSSGPSFYTKIGILRPYHRIKMSETIHIILHVRDLIRKGRPTFSPHLSLQTPNQSFHKVLPHLRLQSKVEDGPEEHWLLSAQDSWKTSTTALLVLALLSTLLFLILLSAVAKIAKHLCRYWFLTTSHRLYKICFGLLITPPRPRSPLELSTILFLILMSAISNIAKHFFRY